MIFKSFTLGNLRNNCYVVADEFTNEAAIIDAPEHPEEIIDYIKQSGFTVDYILLTHHHFDHVDGLSALQKAFPEAKVTQQSANIGMIDIQSIPTPGHTKDGVSFYISHEQTLFSGDTLFFETIGRTDLEDSDHAEELASISERLFALPEHTKVYPGHGKSTTIEWEKAHNPYMVPDS